MTDIPRAIADACALEPGLGLLTDWALVELDESEDFEDYERQELFAQEYAAYVQVFDGRVKELAAHLGQPDFVRRPTPDEEERGVEGMKIAAWTKHSPPLYAGVWHPDRELPIYVFLALWPAAR